MTLADVLLVNPAAHVVGATTSPTGLTHGSSTHWPSSRVATPTVRVRDAQKGLTTAVVPSTDSIEPVVCEALVVGCGVAGNATALRLAEQGVHVTMISAADEPYQSATYYAQGGIIYKAKDDTPQLLSSDIHRAGAGVCDDNAVQKLATEGPKWVEKILIGLSEVPFYRDDSGELALTLEASHNRARILYKADHTGRAIQTSLVDTVRNHPKIKLLSSIAAVDLVMDNEGICRGVLALSKKDNVVQMFRSDFTMLATGGAGDLYVNTSNPQGARGEGIGIAARAGAALKNMQYFQFHPTTLYIPGARRFLLTEALRGEGAILRDRNGRAFAKDYHPDGELAPRDVVARTILSEMAKQNEPCMFLDISHEESEWIQGRFPTIYKHCLEHGIDMTKQPMPVVPAAHYHCGGVEVDLNGCTTIPGLYAAGEVSCTGLHGANRLASTSLLEGLVWACNAADHFLATHDETPRLCDSVYMVTPPALSMNSRRERAVSNKELEEIVATLQNVMWDHFGPLRSKQAMETGLEELGALEKRVEKVFAESALSHKTASLRNAMVAAKEIANAAATATRSVGTHFILPSN